MVDFDIDELKRKIIARIETLNNNTPAEFVLDTAEEILALTRVSAGVACKRCSGFGHRAYSSTATWRGGIGGQVITQDVCDQCWGTGLKDVTGVNLRQLRVD